MCYGFGRSYKLGNINERNFTPKNVYPYFQKGYSDFRKLCQQSLEKAIATLELPYFNWFEHLRRESLKISA
jgi:hypothetical protein